MTFYEWLLKHTNRNSPLGDFARDAKSDKASPALGNTLEAWRSHLAGIHACREAKATLEKIWKSYQRATK